VRVGAALFPDPSLAELIDLEVYARITAGARVLRLELLRLRDEVATGEVDILQVARLLPKKENEAKLCGKEEE
jgi:hypothetical protein